MKLVLASTSPYRRELLARLGVPFAIAVPKCDEEALKEPDKPPTYVATLLARAKALSLLVDYPNAYILGSDQLVDLDGEILGKPGTPEAAVQQLERMQGRRHRLITAVALTCPDGRVGGHVDVTTLAMRSLRRDELERYVQADRPLDCAGSYKIESRGIALFERIESEDFTAITGLPLLAVSSLLRHEGFALP